MKKVSKKIATFILFMVVAFSITTPVLAAVPYKDVTVDSIGGAYYYKEVKFLKKHKVYKGVVKGDKLKPFKKITGREFLKMLINYCGKKNVPISKADRKKLDKTASSVWALKKIYAVSKKMGKGVDDWYPVNFKLTRFYASDYIYGRLFKHFKIKPLK